MDGGGIPTWSDHTVKRRDGIYKNKANEQSAKSHKAKRLRVWAERWATTPACPRCGKEIPQRYRRGAPQKYCSRRCSQYAYARRGENSWREGTVTGTIGAVGELLVSADLLKRGYHVFRSLSPNAVCDLAIITGARAIRVEVTKGNRARTGKAYYSPHNAANYDVIAVWFSDGTVEYNPGLPVAERSAGPLKYSDEDGRAAGGEGVGAASA